MSVGEFTIANQLLPCRASKLLVQPNLRWHANCKSSIFRLAKVQSRQQLSSARGVLCKNAAVEALEAQQDKQEPKPQAASSTPLRREEAILFQGDWSICFAYLSTRNALPTPHQPPQWRFVLTALLKTCLGFGWDSCQVGGWWKIVQCKIPEMKVSKTPTWQSQLLCCSVAGDWCCSVVNSSLLSMSFINLS